MSMFVTHSETGGITRCKTTVSSLHRQLCYLKNSWHLNKVPFTFLQLEMVSTKGRFFVFQVVCYRKQNL